jgi:hypothetical protein
VQLDHDAQGIVVEAKHWGINEVFVLGVDLSFLLFHHFNVVTSNIPTDTFPSHGVKPT